jgi:hypothetical protein
VKEAKADFSSIICRKYRPPLSLPTPNCRPRHEGLNEAEFREIYEATIHRKE